MRAVLLAASLASSGCSLGFGSAYVGQWRAHDEVEYRACLENDAGQCIAERESVRHVPARSYWGVIVPYPAMGAGFVRHEGATTPRYRIEPSLEILQGRGPFAFGVRAGAVVDVRAAVSLNAVGLVHYSLGERISLYGGGGVVPYARLGSETGHGARALGGFQWAFARVRGETHWVLSFEGDTQWLDFASAYRSSGITGHLGLFF